MSDLIAEYNELEKRILAAIRGDVDEALWMEVFAFQRRWNGPYAAFCATRPEPLSWREIPAVPVSAFKRAALCVAPPELVARTFLTSGTTGETRGAHHFVDTLLYDRAAQCGWMRLGLAPHEQFVLVQAEVDAPQSSLSHMMAALGAGGAAQRYFIDPAGRLRMVELFHALEEKIAAAQPVALLGTALAFLNVFEAMDARRLSLPAGSYAMETGGFKGSGRDIPKAELYAKFSQYLGIAVDQVLNEYGMTELSSQFYTRGLRQPHMAGPWLRTLVIDPETGGEVPIGGTGALRIFDLANLGSVLAIETRDLAIRCEEGFELLGRDPAALPRGCSRAADEMLNA
jgi:acyl-coenzyme A synthetase/AMP-(fatty) acid ligase